MQTYKIIMTPDATDDITELSRYIAKNLLAPETALSYVRAIRQEIAKLSEMPGIYKPVDDEPWHSRGVRKILVKNFGIFGLSEKHTIICLFLLLFANNMALTLITFIMVASGPSFITFYTFTYQHGRSAIYTESTYRRVTFY